MHAGQKPREAGDCRLEVRPLGPKERQLMMEDQGHEYNFNSVNHRTVLFLALEVHIQIFYCK